MLILLTLENMQYASSYALQESTGVNIKEVVGLSDIGLQRFATTFIFPQ